MRKKEITFRDPVVENVVDKFVSRSDVGFAKYGKTLRDDKSDMHTWLNHFQEELELLKIDVKDAEKWTEANGFSYTIDEEA